MEQKTVKILSFRAENHNIVKAVMLTPDIFNNRLIQLVGESGNGKSTLLEMLQTAVAGTDAIKSKNVLEKGYLSEALLVDGDVKLYVGAKVTEYKRGENAGSPKFETFLYAKDANDKPYTPIIDGVKATAGEYVKLLTTDLTFNMPALFSENQSEHRKLIERLFKPELDALGAEEVVEKILQLKKKRDASRLMCQASGAYMERFEDEGYTEVALNMLKKPDIKETENKIFEKKLEKSKAIDSSDDKYKLIVAEKTAEKTAALQKIKDDLQVVKDKIQEQQSANQKVYDEETQAYLRIKESCEKKNESFITVRPYLEAIILPGDRRDEILRLYDEEYQDFVSVKNGLVAPVLKPVDAELITERENLENQYDELEKAELKLPEKGEVDVSEIDKQIESLETLLKSQQATDELYNRFQLWKQWMEDQGKYEVQVDVLRKMYAKIDCGVPGMKIVPVTTDSERIEVWIQYDGQYDPDFFLNANKESRYIFQYSSFQRSAIGVMLQAARLNLKPKALRLAIVDDVAFTQKGLAILSKLCEDLNVQLITSRTDDYDKEKISDGEIIVEGGEVFFNKS